MDFVLYLATAAAAYLLGSLPTGYLMARARGVDIRAHGSGNIGATNVFRILGKPAGVAVLVIDGLKGYAACAWVTDLMLQWFGAAPGVVEPVRITAGMAAVLGHNYTCWLRFKGGKGIATSAGVLAALVPGALLIILTIWIVVFALTKYVSLASISASFALPFATWFMRHGPVMIAVSAALGVLAIYKHRANIQRLLEGTESRIGSKPREARP